MGSEMCIRDRTGAAAADDCAVAVADEDAVRGSSSYSLLSM